uniref:Large proline-rich protein BAG6 domain-containing protein n=1 Tax=Timema bartmani TaxID=61472 RepID=A0A7R9ETL3_9NEOP|nr:unnamed protein product [Timema bartmani]
MSKQSLGKIVPEVCEDFAERLKDNIQITMIELTVKTLDSRNHSFEVADDVNVNGKVIHLVQRAPPQAFRSNGSPSTGRSSSAGPQRRSTQHRTPRMDGNAMYLGAMAFPAELVDTQGSLSRSDGGIQSPAPTQSLSQTRLSLAHQMLVRAGAVLDKLENPTSTDTAEPDSPPGEAENGSNSNGESPTPPVVGAPNIVPSNGNNNGGEPVAPGPVYEAGTIAHAAHAATAAAIAAAVSAAHAAGVPNITIVRAGQGHPEPVDVINLDEAQSRTEPDSIAQDTPMNVPETSSPEPSAPLSESTSQAPPPDTPDAPSAEPSGSNVRRLELPRTSVMADLLDELNRVNERLLPFLQIYHQIMRDDTSYEGNTTGAADSQRIFNQVSQVMHFLSHAYHAMSDVVCDFSTPPPRSLRCRPVFIQHSALLQAGIPIQAQINVTANRGSNTTSGRTTTSTAAMTDNLNVETTPSQTENGTSLRTTHDRPTASVYPLRNGVQASESDGTASAQGLDSSPRETTPDGESASESSTAEGTETLPRSRVRGLNSDNRPRGDPRLHVTPRARRTGAANFPWGPPPPPEFIQNLMQAVAGQMMGRAPGGLAGMAAAAAAAAASAATQAGTSTQAGTVPGAGVPGQNSQARGNTATHPTTSTQTRSTSRPHVHLAPAMQSFANSYFDPFLLCNSHHVRISRRRLRSQLAPSLTVQTDTRNGSVSVNIMGGSVGRTGGLASSAPPQADGAPSQPSAPAPDDSDLTEARTSLMNMLSSLMGASQRQGSSQQPSETEDASAPRQDYDALSNFVQSLLNRTFHGGEEAMPIMQDSFTLADMLRSVSDHSFVEGESFFIDLFIALARVLTFGDIMALRLGNTQPLTRVRPQLREFVSHRVLLDEPSTQESIARGTDRILAELRPHFNVLSGARLREDVDLITTMNQYHQMRLPEVIEIITEGSEAAFGASLIRWCKWYLKELFAIILHCCLDGPQGMETIVRNFVLQLTSGVSQTIQNWTLESMLGHLREFVRTLDIPLEDIQRFLVYRIATTPASVSHQTPEQVTNQAAASPETMETDNAPSEHPVPVNHVKPEEELIPGAMVMDTASLPDVLLSAEPWHADVPSTMETDNAPSEHPVPVNHVKPEEELIPGAMVMDTASLPDVLLSAEPWHADVPSDWVPIITRDSQRQRRQNPQPPFSDAYLSGMPSKRRKVVSSAKPQGSLSQVISESVCTAVNAAGVGPVLVRDTVSQAAGNDPTIQLAYQEQLRAAVQESLAQNTDYSSTRFPNTAKYFTK